MEIPGGIERNIDDVQPSENNEPICAFFKVVLRSSTVCSVDGVRMPVWFSVPMTV